MLSAISQIFLCMLEFTCYNNPTFEINAFSFHVKYMNTRDFPSTSCLLVLNNFFRNETYVHLFFSSVHSKLNSSLWRLKAQNFVGQKFEVKNVLSKKKAIPYCAALLVFSPLNANILQSMRSKILQFCPHFLILIGCKILRVDVKNKQWHCLFTLHYRDGSFKCSCGQKKASVVHGLIETGEYVNQEIQYTNSENCIRER